jgi:hypothetical protein
VKNIAAILILALLVFNWIGYRFVVNYLQQNADRKLESRIDQNDFDESQLVEIRVPLNMPYQNTWTEFERHYGQIEIDGKFYNYVKRKIEDGWLILKCLPNEQKQNIRNNGDVLFQITDGIAQDQNSKSSSPISKLVKIYSSDYENQFYSFNGDFFNSEILNSPTNEFIHTDNYRLLPDQPPENFLFS